MVIYTVYADGGTSNKQKQPYYSYKIYVSGSTHIHQCTRVIPYRATNNMAEYQALINAVKDLPTLYSLTEKDYVRIYMDSKLVVGQVVGNWNINKVHLRELQAIAVELLQKLPVKGFRLSWVPRNIIFSELGH